MSKFAKTARPAAPGGPLVSSGVDFTHEGGVGYTKDAKTALFTLAVTNLVSENTFYEKGETRDERFERLIHQVTAEDPEWVGRLIPWLRLEANMRTASLVAAAEYVRAGGPDGRKVVNDACQRAEEPAELLAYWISRHGRAIPKGVKNGLADAAVRLYNERSAVKYDQSGARVRMGDVLDLCHPTPRAEWQSVLFRYLIDDRHGRGGDERSTVPPQIADYRTWIAAGAPLEAIPKVATWENASAHHKTDAAFWEAIIPQMGYMALLRNLRNFEQAGVGADHLKQVAEKLADPEQVANSRQLPFRFWSAWEHSGTILFGPALEKAAELSTQNIPTFGGRTLVMVDTSGSMNYTLSTKSKITRAAAGAFFGAAVIKRSKDGALWPYATGTERLKDQGSILRVAAAITRDIGMLGHGTNTWLCTERAWETDGPFDRILVFTDCQDHPNNYSHFIPAHVPVYVWDLAGYRTSNIETGSRRYLLAGLSDHCFKLIQLLEEFRPGVWPWMTD